MNRLLACIILPILSAQAATFYVDGRNGGDDRDGRSPSTAWQSIDRANQALLSSGDSLRLRAGSVWQGVTLKPRGNGTGEAPISLGRYGEGADPVLAGEGKVSCVLRLENQQGWDISHLDISNQARMEGKRLRGVEVAARDCGRLAHLHFSDLTIHNVNGDSTYANDGDNVAKSFGGFVSLIEGNVTQTFWSDFVIERCRFVDDGPAGLTMFSSWTSGHRANDPATWCPSLGVIVRACIFQRINRNGLVIRGCAAPLVEHNLFDHCGLTGSGNACFAFHCDDALFQYNEACFTKYNPGDVDAAGFDSDYNCRRTVFQYNYSHDNDYGFILICCNGKGGFNEGTIVRNNISQNDGGVIFRLAGPVRGSRISNNTVFTATDMRNPKGDGALPCVVAHKSWAGWASDTEFADNIIVNQAGAVYEAGRSVNTRYRHNLYFDTHPVEGPADPRQVTGDPLFNHPGGGNSTVVDEETDWKSAFAAYSLGARSPGRGLGASLPAGP